MPGVGPGTAAQLLEGGLALEDLPTSGRLAAGRGRLVADAWQQALDCKALIQMRTDLPLSTLPVGLPTPELDTPRNVVEKLGLW